jgi:hypothetical protein
LGSGTVGMHRVTLHTLWPRAMGRRLAIPSLPKSGSTAQYYCTAPHFAFDEVRPRPFPACTAFAEANQPMPLLFRRSPSPSEPHYPRPAINRDGVARSGRKATVEGWLWKLFGSHNCTQSGGSERAIRVYCGHAHDDAEGNFPKCNAERLRQALPPRTLADTAPRPEFLKITK